MTDSLYDELLRGSGSVLSSESMSDLVSRGLAISLISIGTMGCSTLSQVDLEEIFQPSSMSVADVKSLMFENRGALTLRELIRRECRKMDSPCPEDL